MSEEKRRATVAEEVAVAEFDRFVEAMDLDVDPKRMDEEDLKSYQAARGRVVDAIIDGHLVIDEEGRPIYTPRKDNTEPITFYEPTGASLMAMDGKRKGRDVGKMFATLADITRQSEQRFAKMSNRDIKVCLAIVALFLG